MPQKINNNNDNLTFDIKNVELLTSKDGEKKNKRAKIVVVKSGWNLNDIFIEDSVLEELVPAVMQKPKLYLDHEYFEMFGRSGRDWAATFESVEKVGDEIHGIISFTSNPNTVWLYEELEKDPSAVQFSIHVRGVLSEFKDEALNRNGYKMTKLQLYRSTDIVSYAAAGGKGIEVLNSLLENKLNLFNTFLNNQQKTEENDMSVTNAKELRTAYPEFLNEILNEVSDPLKSNITLLEKEKETQSISLAEKEAEIAILKTKVEEITNSVTTLTEERDALKLKVDDFELATKTAEWKKTVEAEIVNAELDPKAITEVFKNTLIKNNDIEEVKKLINDRKELFNNSLSVISNGGTRENTEEEEVTLNVDELANKIKAS